MQFDNASPIYKQIIEDFKKKMIRGELKKGDKILSQREYAQMATVNPNTVQRAYREMESMNLVETLRGQGTFVCVTPEQLVELKKEMATGLLESFITEMRSLDYSDVEILGMLKGYLDYKEGD
ncbi:MAG: GntR family transcriptional regulator [Syntrophomonadaceae bacterium]|nr:GntR family transcriptional regulator [Syntrophomonadaceae bacterium]